MRIAAASITGPVATNGRMVSDQTIRIPQKSWTKNSSSGGTAAAQAPITIVSRQSDALSAMRPINWLRTMTMKYGAAFTMPICSGDSPFPASQIGRNGLETAMTVSKTK